MTKQVGSIIRDLGGTPLANIPVEIELVLGQAWHPNTDVGYGQLYKTQTDASGFWLAVLPENDILNPVGTAYRAVEKVPPQYGGSRVYLFQVLLSLSGGLNYVDDLLIPELSPVGAINNFLTKQYADATYATLGTSGSAGPPGPAGPAGGTPLPNIYSTEAALLLDTPVNGTIAFAADTGRFWGRTTAWKYLTGGNPTERFTTALTAGTTSAGTALVLGTINVPALPYARTGRFDCAIARTQSIATDNFELDVTDGTNTRSTQTVGPTTTTPMATPALIVPIAANTPLTVTASIIRATGTGTATVSGSGNFSRLEGYVVGTD